MRSQDKKISVDNKEVTEFQIEEMQGTKKQQAQRIWEVLYGWHKNRMINMKQEF